MRIFYVTGIDTYEDLLLVSVVPIASAIMADHDGRPHRKRAYSCFCVNTIRAVVKDLPKTYSREELIQCEMWPDVRVKTVE